MARPGQGRPGQARPIGDPGQARAGQVWPGQARPPQAWSRGERAFFGPLWVHTGPAPPNSETLTLGVASPGPGGVAKAQQAVAKAQYAVAKAQ